MRDLFKVKQATGSDGKKEGEKAVLTAASRQAVPAMLCLPSPEGNARGSGFAAGSWKRRLDFGKAQDSLGSVFSTHPRKEHLNALDT